MKTYDVIIVGGSYAGLSAAMALGRALRSVLIIDSGKPCNRQTPHSHNFITHDGEKPAVIAVRAREQVLRYATVTWLQDTVVKTSGSVNNFLVETAQQEKFAAQRLLFTTGIKDILPDIPGFAECWGISAIHCPYCHGYEVRGQQTGIVSNGDIALVFSNLIHQWTKTLTLFTNGPATLQPEQRNVLQQKGIGVVEKTIKALDHQDGYLQQLVFTDGSNFPLTALYSRPVMQQHCDQLVAMGCECTDTGFIKVDDFMQTNIPGVYAAGDNTSPLRSVASAVAAGNRAGAMINHHMIDDLSGH